MNDVNLAVCQTNDWVGWADLPRHAVNTSMAILYVHLGLSNAIIMG